MAFVLTQLFWAIRNEAMLRAVPRVVRRLTIRRPLTPLERTNLRASRPPLAVITASLGGHPHR